MTSPLAAHAIAVPSRVCERCGSERDATSTIDVAEHCAICGGPLVPPGPGDVLSARIRRTAGRTWWTRERVLTGLRRFYHDHNTAPLSTEEWHRLTGRHGERVRGHAGRRRYPSLYAVLRHFETFRQAWAAAGIEVGRRQESWSELEDWYLREGVGLIPRSELARDLNRTSDAVHRRLYDLGLHSYHRWGWTLHRLERVAQVPRHRLQKYLDRGDLPYLRGSKCV